MPTITAVVALIEDRLEKLGQNAPAELSARIVTRTPVDTGRLRQAWGSSQPFESIQPGDTVQITNDTEYAYPIEMGHSREQAPGGMVRPSVAEWQQIVDEIAGER